MTNLKDLLAGTQRSEPFRVCKISPANREDDRQTIAAEIEAFLKAGKTIHEIPNNFSLENKKAA